MPLINTPPFDEKTMIEIRCSKCNDTGLIPFVKGGRVITNAWQDCDCKQPEPEHFGRVWPEDFDFPMSYEYYRGLCQEHGWPDPKELTFKSEGQASPPGQTVNRIVYHHVTERRADDERELAVKRVRQQREGLVNVQDDNRIDITDRFLS